MSAAGHFTPGIGSLTAASPQQKKTGWSASRSTPSSCRARKPRSYPFADFLRRAFFAATFPISIGTMSGCSRGGCAGFLYRNRWPS